MIALDGDEAVITQQGNHFVGKEVLADAVAETNALVHLAHEFHGLAQRRRVAMQIGNDADQHWPSTSQELLHT